MKGFTKPEKKIRELNEHLDHKVWFPKLIRSVLYSEILDDYFKVVITYKTKDSINELKGFDNYILKTPVQDLKSQFGLDLRRQMLIRLAKKDYYPENAEKFAMIEEKYKEHVIPVSGLWPTGGRCSITEFRSSSKFDASDLIRSNSFTLDSLPRTQLEEAEWFGLPENSAIFKQLNLEQKSRKVMPLKVAYAEQLVQELTELRDNKDSVFEG